VAPFKEPQSIYVAGFPRNQFIGVHRLGEISKASGFDDFVSGLGNRISDYESYLMGHGQQQAKLQTAQDIQRNLLISQYKPSRPRF
jgi:hypothetical protein